MLPFMLVFSDCTDFSEEVCQLVVKTDSCEQSQSICRKSCGRCETRKFFFFEKFHQKRIVAVVELKVNSSISTPCRNNTKQVFYASI